MGVLVCVDPTIAVDGAWHLISGYKHGIRRNASSTTLWTFGLCKCIMYHQKVVFRSGSKADKRHPAFGQFFVDTDNLPERQGTCLQ
jgi:hypothetical protein